MRATVDPNAVEAATPTETAADNYKALPVSLPGHWSSAAGRMMAVEYAALSRDQLGKSAMSDFELANAQFLAGRDDLDLFVYQTAAKDRIRWLSVRLAIAEAINTDLVQALSELLPSNVCTENTNVPDTQVLPCDVTMGELRRARAAISKATPADGASRHDEDEAK